MTRNRRRASRRRPGGAGMAGVAVLVIVAVVSAVHAGGSRSRSRAGAPPLSVQADPGEPGSSSGAMPPVGSRSCRARGPAPYARPDPVCTPGATNPAVTQADIGSTICRSGWTSTVRPPESYTEPLKLQQMVDYGDHGSPRLFEEDHLISLELGGSPTDARNLWPEPGASPNPKDAVEDAARRAVCDGDLTLAAAQAAIATDWVALGRRLGLDEPAPAGPGAASSR